MQLKKVDRIRTIFFLILCPCGTLFASQPLVLWYGSDAGTSFTDALPIGNGYMGGMVYGGVAKDVIGLNEGTVWSDGPGNNNKTGAANSLATARSQIFAGDYTGADATVAGMIGSGPARYVPVGNLNLSFSGHTATNYRRELDLETAIAKTTYSYNGVNYTREYFASYPDHVIVVRISADKSGSVGFSAGLDTPHGNNSKSTSGNNLLTLNATVNAIKFQTRVKILNDGGTVSAANNTLTVSGANSATLVLTITTNFKAFNDVSGDPDALASSVFTALGSKSYVDLKTRHLADYQNLFNRVNLDLGTAATNSTVTTTERVKQFNSSNDPTLVRLYYQFGRYLMIASSRAGGQPANLQGIWNKDLYPTWGSKYTTNINLQMNYWMTETANLAECAIPLIDKTKAMVVQGSLTAKTHWGINEGWVLHHNTDLWNRTAPIDGQWGLWPTGAGWLSTHLWEHFQFNPNQQYLQDVYPTLKGAAQFLLNSLVEEPVSGNKYLVTVPSTSPENAHSGFWTCFAPTMDVQITRDVFNYTIKASEVLGTDAELRQKLQAAILRLPPHKVGKYSQLQEWFQDWDDPKSDHRHVSHLYGLFPSNQISVDGTPDLAAAAKTTLTQRGDMATGWSLAWKINLWARLKDGNHAYNLIKLLLTPDRTYNNLFDAHPPFQIDGNFGAVSGINEMLVQSQQGEMELLPALPTVWANGFVTGLRARGGFEIDSMTWSGGKLTYVSIKSQKGGALKIKSGTNTTTITTKESGDYIFDANLKLTNQPFDPVTIPAKIEAENYVSMEGAQIEADENDNLNMGWINNGDWAKYYVKSPKAGNYLFRASVATAMDSINTIFIKDSTGKELGSLQIDPAKTDGWHDWYTAETKIALPAGPMMLKLDFSGGSDYLFNLDWIEFAVDASTVISTHGQNKRKYDVAFDPSHAIRIHTPSNMPFQVSIYSPLGKRLANYTASTDLRIPVGDMGNIRHGWCFVVITDQNGFQQFKLQLESKGK